MRASRSHQLSVRGLQLHLREWPAEAASDDPALPPIVILHGWQDTSATWQRLVDFLPRQRRILAPDARGFGLSGTAGDTYIFPDYLGDLDGLARAFDLPVFDLIGHSMGGQIAALYAGLRSERVRRLVILDALHLPLTTPEQAPERLRGWLDDLTAAPADKTYADYAELAARIARYHPGLDAQTTAFIARCWAAPAPDGRVRLLADPRHRQRGPLLYRDEEARAVFSQIAAPTLILDAERTNLAGMCPPSVREERIAAIRNHQRECLADCGHMMHFDRPEATAQAVMRFLDAAD
ncbi:MAG: alpha/beta hydrolase [Oceanococcaceae bacterium]